MATLISIALARVETLDKLPTAVLIASYGAATPEIRQRIDKALEARKPMPELAEQHEALLVGDKKRRADESKTDPMPGRKGHPNRATSPKSSRPATMDRPAVHSAVAAERRTPRRDMVTGCFIEHDEYGLGKIIAQHGPDALVIFRKRGQRIINKALLRLNARRVAQKLKNPAWSIPPLYLESHTPFVAFNHGMYHSFRRSGRIV